MRSDLYSLRILLFLVLSCLVHGGLIFCISDFRRPFTGVAAKSAEWIEITIAHPDRTIEKKQIEPPAQIAPAPKQPMVTPAEVVSEKEAVTQNDHAKKREEPRREVARAASPPPVEPRSEFRSDLRPETPSAKTFVQSAPAPVEAQPAPVETPELRKDDLEALFSPSSSPVEDSATASPEASRPAFTNTLRKVMPPDPAPGLGLRQEKLREEYLANLHRLLSRYRRYPLPARRGGQQGTVMVRFRIAADGALVESLLLESAGWPLLDSAALATVRSVKKFPPPPEALKEDIVVCDIPIEFSLSR